MSGSRGSPFEAAQRLYAEGRLEEALAAGWQAFIAQPDSIAVKALVARLLRRAPGMAQPSMADGLLRLLRDPGVEPAQVANAGWKIALAATPAIEDMPALAAWLEGSALALALLEETWVAWPEAERRLTRVRRWLLVEQEWPAYPRLAAALAAQARHNGGAWPFDPGEAAMLDKADAFRAAYLPDAPAELRVESGENPVARQYETWPYPLWNRITIPVPTTLKRTVDALDPGGPAMPEATDLLIAGCGTGREPAIMARRYPDARVTAIDVSEASLAYARAQCAGLGIEFHRLDLREAGRLGRRFDAIFCSGVLHHLPDPQAGWRALVDLLRPGGVMRVLLYSKIGRLKVAAAKALIADLAGRPDNDDLLREVRRRLLERAPNLLADSFDFYTLAGVHDLLLNRHEDLFDIPRIGRALEALGLRLLKMNFPVAAAEAEYRKERPQDPHLRDLAAIAAFEQRHPFLFRSMYDFWCRKPHS